MNAEVWVLIGGSGTFGREAIRQLLADDRVRKVRVCSRDERKQAEVRAENASAVADGRLITMLGDVRDLERMERACEGATHVAHAAALKRIEVCQADVEECIRTNVIGSMNVAKAAERQGVEAAVLLSSDKSADPVNAYGASKAMAEHVWLNTSRAWGSRSTRLVAVRYGNVIGSRGSVIEAWRAAAAAGHPITVRGEYVTRFWLSIEHAVALALWTARTVPSGNLIIPKLPAADVMSIAKAAGVEVKREALGDAEKDHETLLTAHEWARAVEVSPQGVPWLAWRVPSVTGVGHSPARAVLESYNSESAKRLSGQAVFDGEAI